MTMRGGREGPVAKVLACVSAALLTVLTGAACHTSPAPIVEKKLISTTDDPYRADIEKFRQQREAKLTSDTGWLTIAGLYFLTKPETMVGSDAATDVVLPAGAPPRVGTFVLAK